MVKLAPVLGLFGPETVQFIDMHHGQLTILAPRTKKAGAVTKVRVALHGYKKPRVDIPMLIQSVRPSESPKGHVCIGSVVLEEEYFSQLEDLLYSYAIRPDLGRSARRSLRLPIGLKAMGRELPGFSAVTVDVSLHGVRLNCHGPLKQGLVVNLTLESDIGSLGNMVVRGRVIWSRENEQTRGHMVGVEFADLSEEQSGLLASYHHKLAGRLRGNVMHRQIADGEMVARPSDQEAPSESEPVAEENS